MSQFENQTQEQFISLFREDVGLAVTDPGFACAGQALAELEPFLSCDTDNSKARFVRRFAEERGFEVAIAVMVFRLLQRLTTGVLEHDLKADDLRERSDELPGISEMEAVERERFFSLIDSVREAAPRLLKIKRRIEEAAGVLPMLKKAAFSVEGRLITLGLSEDAYEQVPIASILILLDSGDPGSLTFQATESGVDDLIELLELVKKRMSGLRKHSEAAS